MQTTTQSTLLIRSAYRNAAVRLPLIRPTLTCAGTSGSHGLKASNGGTIRCRRTRGHGTTRIMAATPIPTTTILGTSTMGQPRVGGAFPWTLSVAVQVGPRGVQGTIIL